MRSLKRKKNKFYLPKKKLDPWVQKRGENKLLLEFFSSPPDPERELVSIHL